MFETDSLNSAHSFSQLDLSDQFGFILEIKRSQTMMMISAAFLEC